MFESTNSHKGLKLYRIIMFILFFSTLFLLLLLSFPIFKFHIIKTYFDFNHSQFENLITKILAGVVAIYASFFILAIQFASRNFSTRVNHIFLNPFRFPTFWGVIILYSLFIIFIQLVSLFIANKILLYNYELILFSYCVSILPLIIWRSADILRPVALVHYLLKSIKPYDLWHPAGTSYRHNPRNPHISALSIIKSLCSSNDSTGARICLDEYRNWIVSDIIPYIGEKKSFDKLTLSYDCLRGICNCLLSLGWKLIKHEKVGLICRLFTILRDCCIACSFVYNFTPIHYFQRVIFGIAAYCDNIYRKKDTYASYMGQICTSYGKAVISTSLFHHRTKPPATTKHYQNQLDDLHNLLINVKLSDIDYPKLLTEWLRFISHLSRTKRKESGKELLEMLNKITTEDTITKPINRYLYLIVNAYFTSLEMGLDSDIKSFLDNYKELKSLQHEYFQTDLRIFIISLFSAKQLEYFSEFSFNESLSPHLSKLFGNAELAFREYIYNYHKEEIEEKCKKENIKKISTDKFIRLWKGIRKDEFKKTYPLIALYLICLYGIYESQINKIRLKQTRIKNKTITKQDMKIIEISRKNLVLCSNLIKRVYRYGLYYKTKLNTLFLKLDLKINKNKNIIIDKLKLCIYYIWIKIRKKGNARIYAYYINNMLIYKLEEIEKYVDNGGKRKRFIKSINNLIKGFYRLKKGIYDLYYHNDLEYQIHINIGLARSFALKAQIVNNSQKEIFVKESLNHLEETLTLTDSCGYGFVLPFAEIALNKLIKTGIMSEEINGIELKIKKYKENIEKKVKQFMEFIVNNKNK